MIAALTLWQSRARRTLRELIGSCRRDIALYRKRVRQIDDREVRSALAEIVVAREHLATALANVPGHPLLPGMRAGTLRDWEAVLRTRFGRIDPLEIADELEQAEGAWLEQFEDAILDRRLGAGLRITLERHLPLLRGAQERALAAAMRLRMRKPRPKTGLAQAADVDLVPPVSRALTSFFRH